MSPTKEATAKAIELCSEWDIPNHGGECCESCDDIAAALDAQAKAAVEAERERCASLVQQRASRPIEDGYRACEDIAAAIRKGTP